MVASKTDPKDIKEEHENIEENKVEFEPLALADGDAINHYVRHNKGEKIKVNTDGNTINLNGEEYYVFAIALGIGKHRGSRKYKIELGTSNLGDEISIEK